MKKIMGCFVCLLILMSVGSVGRAQTFEESALYDVTGVEFELGDNQFLAGNTIRLNNGMSSKTYFMAGNNILVEQTQLETLFMAGNSIEVQSETTVMEGFIAGNHVSLDGLFKCVNIVGNKVNVMANASVVNVSGNDVTLNGAYGEVNAAGENIVLNGEANSVKLAGRNVEINGVINGDLRVAGKEITFGQQAQITGQIVIEKEPGQSIEGSIDLSEIQFVDEHTVNFNIGFNPVVSYVFKLMNLFLLFGVTILFVKFGSGVLDEFETQFFAKPWMPFLVGLGGLILIPVVIVVSAVTVVGIPITIVLAISYAIMLYLAPVVSGTLIGRRSKVSQNPYLLACFGVLVIQLCSDAPFVGGIIGLATLLFSLGSFICLSFKKK